MSSIDKLKLITLRLRHASGDVVNCLATAAAVEFESRRAPSTNDALAVHALQLEALKRVTAFAACAEASMPYQPQHGSRQTCTAALSLDTWSRRAPTSRRLRAAVRLGSSRCVSPAVVMTVCNRPSNVGSALL